MEALSHAATVADLIKISSAADWQGCDVRRFGWAAAAKLITLGSAEKYKNDADGEKARVDGIFTKYKAASSRAVQSRACTDLGSIAVSKSAGWGPRCRRGKVRYRADGSRSAVTFP